MLEKLFIFFNTSSDHTVYFLTFCNVRHESEREIVSFNQNSIVINGAGGGLTKQKRFLHCQSCMIFFIFFFFPYFLKQARLTCAINKSILNLVALHFQMQSTSPANTCYKWCKRPQSQTCILQLLISGSICHFENILIPQMVNLNFWTIIYEKKL